MKNFNHSFYIKKDKLTEIGLVPIFLKIRCHSTETSCATSFNINPDRWKLTKQLKISKREEEIKIRKKLDALLESLVNISERMNQEGIPITAATLKLKLHSRSEVKETTNAFLQLYDAHNEKYKKLVEIGERSHASLVKHRTVRKHLANFITKDYGSSDIPLSKLNLLFIDNFDMYLRTDCSIGNNTVIKIVRCCKKIINEALKYEWIEKDPFRLYNGKWKDIEVEFLTEIELKAIEKKEFATERLSVVRDIFVFSCYTGYAPIDVNKLTVEDIKVIDGQQWIYTSRTKTSSRSNVMLLPKAVEIIEKYKDHPFRIATGKLLPNKSNQKTNEYLKEIADLCDIKKKLHHYIARHTFATTVTLGKGISLEVVSKMMGHKSIKQTQHYAKILDHRVGSEMLVLKTLYENEKKAEIL